MMAAIGAYTVAASVFALLLPFNSLKQPQDLSALTAGQEILLFDQVSTKLMTANIQDATGDL